MRLSLYARRSHGGRTADGDEPEARAEPPASIVPGLEVAERQQNDGPCTQPGTGQLHGAIVRRLGRSAEFNVHHRYPSHGLSRRTGIDSANQSHSGLIPRLCYIWCGAAGKCRSRDRRAGQSSGDAAKSGDVYNFSAWVADRSVNECDPMHGAGRRIGNHGRLASMWRNRHKPHTHRPLSLSILCLGCAAHAARRPYDR